MQLLIWFSPTPIHWSCTNSIISADVGEFTQKKVFRVLPRFAVAPLLRRTMSTTSLNIKTAAPSYQQNTASSSGELRDLYPPFESYDKNFLKVSDIHTIYYEQAGNPEGLPAIVLHGGPVLVF